MKTIVYLNPDCFTDTDMTVLKHLSKEYHVVWYYIHESIKTNTITTDQAETYAAEYGIELHIVDPKVRNRNPKNLLFYSNIAKEINQIKPDLVYHCQRDPYWSLIVRLVLKCKNVVLGVHDVQSHSYKMTISRFLEKSSRGLSIRVHQFFVTFSINQQKLFREVYAKDSFMVGMSCKDFGKSNLLVPSISEGVRLLFFGSINKYKGLDLLIQALEKLRVTGFSNLSLTIAGKGNYWEECRSLMQTKDMYNLQVRFISNEEIPDLMSSHHFLVLPYRDATQSGPLAIAVAYELPVIAPNFGCFSDTYSECSAILYPQAHLEEALMQASKLSARDYNQLKSSCRKVKEANNEEIIAKHYIDYFNAIMASEN